MEECIVRTTAKNAAGEILYKTDIQTIDCSSSDIVVPDTGVFLEKLDISHTDFLITGLIAFAVFAVFAIVYIAKRHPKAKSYAATSRNRVSKKSIKRTNSASKTSARKTTTKKVTPAKKSTVRKKTR